MKYFLKKKSDVMKKVMEAVLRVPNIKKLNLDKAKIHLVRMAQLKLMNILKLL